MTLPIDRTRGAVDHPGSEDLIQDIIDGLNGVNTSELSTTKLFQVANGSFEASVGSFVVATDNGGWTWTPSGAGTCAVTQNASNVFHGLQAVAITSGGTNTNGGTLESTNFIPTTGNIFVWLNWYLKCSVVGVAVKVSIEFYDYLQSIISTTCIYKSVLNPTSYEWYDSWAFTPSGCRFIKILITVGAASSASGVVYVDGMDLGKRTRDIQASAAFPLGAQPSGMTLTSYNYASQQLGVDGIFSRYTHTTDGNYSGVIATNYSVIGGYLPFVFGRVRFGGTSIYINSFFGMGDRRFYPTGVTGYTNSALAGLLAWGAYPNYFLVTDNNSGTFNLIDIGLAREASITQHDVGIWYDSGVGKVILKIDNYDPVETNVRIPASNINLYPQLIQLNGTGTGLFNSPTIDIASMKVEQAS